VAGWSDDYVQRLWRDAHCDYATFVRLDRLAWLRSMCDFLRIPEPPEASCLELAEHAAAYVRPRIRAAIPGAVEAIQHLHEMGYKLHTASAESSHELADYLGPMGVRTCFGRLYGPDLVGTLKTGPEYYARVFADAGVAPEQALVVDDRPDAIAWAMGIGARGVLISSQAAIQVGPMCLHSLLELPAVIAGLD
jgi:HAD superfamily hydrolase (TIGR01509 family)